MAWIDDFRGFAEGDVIAEGGRKLRGTFDSAFPAKARRLLDAMRSHWGIENGCTGCWT